MHHISFHSIYKLDAMPHYLTLMLATFAFIKHTSGAEFPLPHSPRDKDRREYIA